jgi:chromosomal replication initiation ATPase DnaA
VAFVNVVSQLACRFGRSDFVAIEDIGDLRERPATLAELGRLIAGWVAHGARVVCTLECSLQAVTEFERRLPPPPISHVVTLHKPTRHEMCEILRSLAAAAAVSIDRQSLTDLAAWCDGDIRRAVGAVRQLTFEATYRKTDLIGPERSAPR